MRKNRSLLACLIIGSMIINTSYSFSAGELKEDNVSEDSVLMDASDTLFIDDSIGSVLQEDPASAASDSDLLFEEYSENLPEEFLEGNQGDEAFGEDTSMEDEFLIEDADEEASDAFLPEETELTSEASDLIFEDISGTGQGNTVEGKPIISEEQVYFPDDSGETPEELLEGYLEQLAVAAAGETSVKKRVGDRLTGAEAIIYQRLYDAVCEVAAGTRTSTKFEISMEDVSCPAAEMGIEVVSDDERLTSEDCYSVINRYFSSAFTALDALSLDYPFELYWRDLMQGTGMHSDMVPFLGKNEVGEYIIKASGTLTIEIPVSSDYSKGEYEVDPAVGESIQTCVNNAVSIVQAYASKSDYNKLRGYLEEICTRVEYNYDALNSDYRNSNPWQLIWVFDGDDTTDVVCEGYSKAFQYLCNLTEFNGDVVCRTVTGYEGSPDRGHMWNTVRMEDGKNYLVDVTFHDGSRTEETEPFFLWGAFSGDPISGYSYGDDNFAFLYVFDEEIRELYGEELYMAIGEPYHTHEIVTVNGTDPTCTATGLTSGTICSGCGKVIVGQEVIPATGHTAVIDEAVAPTCTDTGLTEGSHCSKCETVIRAQEVIPATGHTPVTDEAVDPTCTETGLTEGSHCSKCGVVLTAQNTRPAIGHDYQDPVWEWEEDLLAANLKLTCRNDSTHKEKVAGSITSKVTENPTYTKTGVRVYTASAVYDGKEYKEEKSGIVPVLTLAGNTEQGISWSIEAGTLTVAKQKNAQTTEIPDYASEDEDEAPWKAAAAELGVTKILVGEGITKIGENSFTGITGMKELDLPISLTSIADSAFNGTPLDDVNVTYSGTPEGWKALTAGTALSGTDAACTHEHSWDTGKITKQPTTSAEGVRTFTCTGCGDTKTEPVAKLTASAPKAISKAPTIKAPSAAATKLTVKWSHFKHTATGAKKIWNGIKKVQIQCSTDKKFKKIIKTTAVSKSETKAVVKGLKKNTTYYIRIRYMNGNIFSKWSGVKKVKTKK